MNLDINNPEYKYFLEEFLDRACVWWNLVGIPHFRHNDEVDVIQEFRKAIESGYHI